MLDTRSRVATVIKAGSAGPMLKSLSTVDLADHLSEARDIVDAAKALAAKIEIDARDEGLRKATEAKEIATAEGYKAGFAHGEIAGHAKAFDESKQLFEAQHAGVVTQMKHAIDEIERTKETLRIAAERDVLEFAVELAFDLTYRIGRHSSKAAVENAKRAIRLVGSRTDLTLRVNPNDLQAMKTYASTVLERVDASPGVSVIGDESLAPGGCIVETDRSRVDATLETQIAELSALLLGDEEADTEPGTMSESQDRHD